MFLKIRQFLIVIHEAIVQSNNIPNNIPNNIRDTGTQVNMHEEEIMNELYPWLMV